MFNVCRSDVYSWRILMSRNRRHYRSDIMAVRGHINCIKLRQTIKLVYYRPVFTRRLMPSVTDGTSIVCASVLLRHISWLLQLQPCITVGYYKDGPAGGVGVRWVRTQCRPKPYNASDASRLLFVIYQQERSKFTSALVVQRLKQHSASGCLRF